jgi:DNA-binding transcriptional MocR family regulator
MGSIKTDLYSQVAELRESLDYSEIVEKIRAIYDEEMEVMVERIKATGHEPCHGCMAIGRHLFHLSEMRALVAVQPETAEYVLPQMMQARQWLDDAVAVKGTAKARRSDG